MEKLLEVLEENTDLIHVEQFGFMHCTYDLTELAEMLKPLLAEVWMEGHTTYQEREQDDCRCGAWYEGECGCGEYGQGKIITTNPYTTKETD